MTKKTHLSFGLTPINPEQLSPKSKAALAAQIREYSGAVQANDYPNISPVNKGMGK